MEFSFWLFKMAAESIGNQFLEQFWHSDRYHHCTVYKAMSLKCLLIISKFLQKSFIRLKVQSILSKIIDFKKNLSFFWSIFQVIFNRFFDQFSINWFFWSIFLGIEYLSIGLKNQKTGFLLNFFNRSKWLIRWKKTEYFFFQFLLSKPDS